MKPTSRSARIDPETLSKRWRISLDAARDTLKATTQNLIQQPVHPITRRFRTDLATIRYRALGDTFYSDTAFSKVKSLTGMTCTQIFCNRDFIYAVPMRSKSEAGNALKIFNEDVGNPREMITDNAKEQVSPTSDFAKRCRFTNTKQRQTEPHTLKQNQAEGMIRVIKKTWKRLMREKNVPPRLWDLAYVYVCNLRNLVARGRDKRTGYEKITGNTPEIVLFVIIS